MHALFIALGGALGALSRHAIVSYVGGAVSSAFPFGTILVNIAGSFCIGFLYVFIAEKVVLHPEWRSILMVGFLGAFTTFSSFSLETVNLLEKGQISLALIYMASSLICCVAAAWLAILLARLL